MARYRKIDPRIWNDAKFSALSSEGKLLFLYLLTAPAMTMIGAMPMRASAVAEELGFDSKRYAIRYQELSQMGIVEYDDRGLFWVKNFLKYNAPDNPKVVISWGNVLDLLPECPLLTKVLKSAQAHCLQRGEGYAEAFSKSFGNGIAYGMPNPMPYQEQEQEQEQEKDICAKPLDFAPDSPADGFALEQENPFSESGNVPVQKIVDIYNEVLGESLGRVVKITPSRAQAIRARWRDILHDCECADKKAGLEMVRDYFKAVSQSNFLMGRTHNPNHPNWRADFDFLLKQKTYTGILEKRYSNGR